MFSYSSFSIAVAFLVAKTGNDYQLSMRLMFTGDCAHTLLFSLLITQDCFDWLLS